MSEEQELPAEKSQEELNWENEARNVITDELQVLERQGLLTKKRAVGILIEIAVQLRKNVLLVAKLRKDRKANETIQPQTESRSN
jgi:hypothetical protein